MKVSVIIPMYNAEKYLGVCLESILIQTFTDFEVLVVDDCSTDESVIVAESYLEKFGGRLKILTLEENTGSGAVPRNVGLDFASGKYVYFVDADDLLIDVALEELYSFAEKYQVEVVYMERGFHCGEKIIPQSLTEVFWNPPNFTTDKPIIESDDLSERMKKFTARAISGTTCSKFLRRDFLIDKGIKFPDIGSSEDVIWTVKILCHAKKILRIPTPLYIYRMHGESATGKKRSPRGTVSFWLNPLINGVNTLDEFLGEINFFTQNPRRRFEVTNFFVKMQIAGMLEALDELTPAQIYEIVHDNLADDKHASLIANLFVFMNYYRDKSRR